MTEPGSSERLRGSVFLTVLGACLAAAILGRARPEALPETAPPDSFAAGRAQRLLARIAARTHPVQSSEHETVRAFLEAELRGLGLEPELQQGNVRGIPLTNLIVRIPGAPGSGTQRASTGSVLCAAHYDSVPTGPGAGDDGVGVVSWLEALRALRARGWVPRNDVLLLLSDGEELGLLGAHLFAAQDPRMDDVRVVVNLEAIGNGGPAVLFELGPESGARVRLYRRAVSYPTGTSLADAVYRRMPNDTDLSVFLRRGIGGFNLALATGSAAYHAPHDTPENLDPRSLQHMGESALALLEELGEADLATLAAPDVTFFDLLGRRLVVWERVWDHALVLLGLVATVLAVRASRRRHSVGELLRALLLHPLECAFVGALAGALWFVLDRGVAVFAPAPGWVPGNTTSTALSFPGLVVAAALLVGTRARSDTRAGGARPAAALLWLAGATVAVAVGMPGATFALAIPLVLAGVSQLLEERTGGAAGLMQALTLATAALVGLPILYQLAQLFQRTPDHALALFSGLAAFLAAPFLPQVGAMAAAFRRPRTLALGIAGCAFLAASLVARVLVWRQGALWP